MQSFREAQIQAEEMILKHRALHANRAEDGGEDGGAHSANGLHANRSDGPGISGIDPDLDV